MSQYEPYVPSPGRYVDGVSYRRVGRSGLQLPEISLGFWHNFGDDTSTDSQRQIMRGAFDLGITHFDLANNYGPPFGSAEENVGRILSKDFLNLRDELVISTKAGYEMWPGPYGMQGSRKHLLSSLDQSLNRLGLEYVDIFYHHRPDPETPLEESMAALISAVAQGKALYVGISSYSPTRTQGAIQILRDAGVPLLIHQPSYSMFNRWIEGGLLDVLGESGVGCIGYSPLAQGLLTNKYLGGIPDGSRASQGKSLRQKHLSEANLTRVKALAAIATERGQSLAQMAVAWTLRDPRVTSTLVGASSIEQLRELVEGVSGAAFTEAELVAIDEHAVEGEINLWSAQSQIP
jgi:L-glyceraldehyde 3-phosphate reductase